MTFVKKQLTPFSSAAADPLFNFSQPFIQQGVISGRYYSAEEVAYGNPKPGYLQATENSDVVTIVASTGIPLRLVFALGLHDANTGGEIGSWRTFTGKSVSNTNLTITASEKAWVYAEINENGQPNNPGAWTVQYASEPAKDRTYSSQETEPNAPVDGDVWFNPITNLLKKYDSDTSQWITRKRVYLGEAGVGQNNYVYTVQSWFPELGYAQYQDSFYPPYYENPWRHYDGVSFTTNGQYTAMEAANWANNFTIAQAVAGNQTAMNAIANSAFAMASVSQASNTMNAIANSFLAIQTLEANTTGAAIEFAANSIVGTTALISNTTSFAYIANSSSYMAAYANATFGMQVIANNAVAQGLILNGTQATTFRNTIANNSSVLSVLKNGSAGNILYDLISTTSSYNTLVANAQGQILALQNAISGPIFAIGGNTVTEITDGGVCYRVHTYTGTGAFNVVTTGDTCILDTFLIGGGGGGAAPDDGSGGGAGGALRDCAFKIAPAPGSSVTCTMTIGAGGAAQFCKGSNTSFAGLVAWGGGSGALAPGGAPPAEGGSVGGSGRTNIFPANIALQPIQPQPACASPNLVQFGCNHPGIAPDGTGSSPRGGAGIGSGGCLSTTPYTINSRKGGIGCQIGITGTNVYYGGGGGTTFGGTNPDSGPAILAGLGGLGGGGMGIEGCNGGFSPTPCFGTTAPSACFDSERNAPLVGCPAPSLLTLKNGLANRGGGGGGSLHGNAPPWPNVGPGAGGSGVGIVRYRIKP
jgi:hypothetical protein